MQVELTYLENQNYREVTKDKRKEKENCRVKYRKAPVWVSH